MSGYSRSAKVCWPIAPLLEGLTSATCCMSHLFLSPARRFVAALADFFFLDQAQVAANVEAQVSREKARDPLDVEKAVGEIRARVWRSLNDPDLARSPIRVVKTPAVVDRGHVVRAAVDEKQRPGLERAEHVLGTAVGDPASRTQPQHYSGQPDERRARQLRGATNVFDQQRAQVTERAVQHQRLHPRLPGRAEQGDHGAHRVAEESDARFGDPLSRKRYDGLELEHLFDSK